MLTTPPTPRPPAGNAPSAAPAPARSGRATAASGRLPHVPGLDGLRGLSVAAVLCFHGGFGWAEGGFLGVSTFFTLSGFLITSLLLAEHRTEGAIDLRAFWVRRVRRLLPASLAAIALALLFGLLAADATQRQELAGDVLACLAYVANWWYLASGQSYADLFAGPSPLLHFWSLAIEEQFYLLFPAVVWLAVRRRQRPARQLTALLAALAATSLALPFLVDLSRDAIYYATPTRAAELLLGALAAAALHRPGIAAALAQRPQVQAAVGGAGLVALVAMVALWATTPQSAGWLYHGGFAAYAVLSATVVVATLVPGGPVESLLSLRALRHLGAISYGAYVYHWPLFLWLDERRTGLDGWALFGVRMAVTVALAEASLRLLERPVRAGRPLLGRPPRRLAAPALAALVVVALVLSVTAPSPAVDFAAAEQQAAELEATAAGAADGAPGRVPAASTAAWDPASAAAPPARLAVFGDSTALLTAMGLQRWSDATHEVDFVPGVARLGCGIARGGARRDAQGNPEPVPAECDQWTATWAEKVRTYSPTVAVVQVGPWETLDRKVPGDDTWRSPGDPVYDAWLLDQLVRAVDVLTVDGASVVWLTSPPVDAELQAGGRFGGGDEVARAERFNELVAQLPVERPGQVAVVDLAGWLAASGRDGDLRPDGVHFSDDGALEAARAWLGPALVDAHGSLWESGRAARLAAVEALPDPGVQLPTDRPPRLLVWGDETAAPVGEALAAWATGAGGLEVTTASVPECGVVRSDARRVDGEAVEVPGACRSRKVLWDAVEATDPDAVLVVTGRFELSEQRYGGEDQAWMALDDGMLDDWLRAELGQVADELHADRRPVLWATSPWYPVSDDPEGDAARAARLNQLLAELTDARSRATWSGLVDLAGLHAVAASGAPDGALASRREAPALPPEAATAVAPELGRAVLEQLGALAVDER